MYLYFFLKYSRSTSSRLLRGHELGEAVVERASSVEQAWSSEPWRLHTLNMPDGVRVVNPLMADMVVADDADSDDDSNVDGDSAVGSTRQNPAYNPPPAQSSQQAPQNVRSRSRAT